MVWRTPSASTLSGSRHRIPPRYLRHPGSVLNGLLPEAMKARQRGEAKLRNESADVLRDAGAAQGHSETLARLWRQDVSVARGTAPALDRHLGVREVSMPRPRSEQRDVALGAANLVTSTHPSRSHDDNRPHAEENDPAEPEEDRVERRRPARTGTNRHEYGADCKASYRRGDTSPLPLPEHLVPVRLNETGQVLSPQRQRIVRFGNEVHGCVTGRFSSVRRGRSAKRTAQRRR